MISSESRSISPDDLLTTADRLFPTSGKHILQEAILYVLGGHCDLEEATQDELQRIRQYLLVAPPLDDKELLTRRVQVLEEKVEKLLKVLGEKNGKDS